MIVQATIQKNLYNAAGEIVGNLAYQTPLDIDSEEARAAAGLPPSVPSADVPTEPAPYNVCYIASTGRLLCNICDFDERTRTCRVCGHVDESSDVRRITTDRFRIVLDDAIEPPTVGTYPRGEVIPPPVIDNTAKD